MQVLIANRSSEALSIYEILVKCGDWHELRTFVRKLFSRQPNRFISIMNEKVNLRILIALEMFVLGEYLTEFQ
jgi:hypothetical protein